MKFYKYSAGDFVMRHKIIDKSQSYKTVVAKFADYLKEQHGIKYEPQFKKLTTEELYNIVDQYFEHQKEIEKLSQNTLERHISALSKVLTPINPEIREYFTYHNLAIF